MTCHQCGSEDLIPYETHPDHGKHGKQRCELACPQDGLFCRRCRYFRPTSPIQCATAEPDRYPIRRHSDQPTPARRHP